MEFGGNAYVLALKTSKRDRVLNCPARFAVASYKDHFLRFPIRVNVFTASDAFSYAFFAAGLGVFSAACGIADPSDHPSPAIAADKATSMKRHPHDNRIGQYLAYVLNDVNRFLAKTTALASSAERGNEMSKRRMAYACHVAA